MSRTPSTALALTFLMLLAASAQVVSAQSLGDAARQEGQRRQGVKSSGKVITNKDLPAPPPTSAVPAAPPAPTAGSPADTKAAPSDGKGGDKAGADAGAGGASDKAKKDDPAGVTKDQKYWSDRMKRLQDDLAHSRTFAEALQSRINGLTTDFVNRDDPKQREVIGRERQRSIEELDRAKKAIADGTRAIADLEEEARRAGVPVGWLR
jgi:hypothetical protein